MTDAAAKTTTANGDGKPFTIIQEGKAKVGFHGEVFYNPVQEFNRDLTVSVLRQLVKERMQAKEEKSSKYVEEPVPKKKKLKLDNEDGSIRILDALSASGLRALRFSQEVPNVDYIMANDFSENAVDSIKENIKLNGVEGKVEANFGDAVMTMMSHRNIDKRFHAVDLDPYGSASVFLDSAVQCVADKGILMITCTDMAVLCGNTPEACYNKYDAVAVRTKCCHEVALRILLRSIDSHANRYTRYIEPLISISVDFYVRVFVRVHTGAVKAKESGTKVGNLFVCTGCNSMETLPLLNLVKTEKGQKFAPPMYKQNIMGKLLISSTIALGADNKCVHCSHPVALCGPLYLGPLHNKDFVNGVLSQLRETPEEERLGTHGRLLGVLTTVSEEAETPFYYEYDQLANTVKCSVPKSLLVRSVLLNAGYQVTGSHCNPRALKTNAPPQFLWDMYRTIAKNANITGEKLADRAPGREILQKPILNEINFTLHPKATAAAKTEQMVRFQCNRGKNWGPRQKAKGSVNSAQAGFQLSAEVTDNNE